MLCSILNVFLLCRTLTGREEFRSISPTRKSVCVNLILAHVRTDSYLRHLMRVIITEKQLITGTGY